MKKKTYTHPDNCPAKNYYAAMHTGDLRHLLILEDYSNLPEPNIIKKIIKRHLFKANTVIPVYDFHNKTLLSAWKNINKNIEGGLLDLKFEREKAEIALSLWDLLTTGEAMDFNIKIAEFIVMLDKGIKSVKVTTSSIMNIAKYPIATTHINEVKELALIIDKEFNSVRSFIDFMAEKIEYKTFQVLQYYFIEALELEYQQNYSFYAEVDYLERVTDRNIDDNICLTRFLQLRKRAKEIQREREKAKNSKKK